MTKFEILSLIISAVSSVATFLAVLVALWQTKINNAKKIKLKIIEDMSAIDTITPNEQILFTQIKIINVGNKNVIIKNAGLRIGKIHYTALVRPDYASNIIESQLMKDFHNNIVLNSEEFAEINWLNKLLNLAYEKFAEENNKKLLDKKIVFYFVDSTGKVYKIKSKKTISYYK